VPRSSTPTPGKRRNDTRPWTEQELAAIGQGAEALGLSLEQALLGRDLKVEEVREVTRMGRRIAAILLLQPQLDVNYLAVKGATWEWGARA
jgi:GAF domain-containing protein